MIRYVTLFSSRYQLTLYRLTSFPILLFIAWYERQAKRNGTSSFYETMSTAAEKVFDTLPRQIKRLSTSCQTNENLLLRISLQRSSRGLVELMLTSMLCVKPSKTRFNPN